MKQILITLLIISSLSFTTYSFLYKNTAPYIKIVKNDSSYQIVVKQQSFTNPKMHNPRPFPYREVLNLKMHSTSIDHKNLLHLHGDFILQLMDNNISKLTYAISSKMINNKYKVEIITFPQKTVDEL